MVTLILLVVLAQGSPAAAGFTVNVRVVDPGFMVLPGVDVSVRAVSDCLSRRPASTRAKKQTTDARGETSFVIESDDSELLVRSEAFGFEAAETCVPGRFVVPQVEPRYVQLRLRLDPSMGVTISEPSIGPAEPPKPPSKWPSGAFWGTYRDARGRHFVVQASDGDTLYVETPDQRIVSFSKRSGTAFTGPDGTIRFVVVKDAVVSLEFAATTIRATRLKER
jgi:hypothetical protein